MAWRVAYSLDQLLKQLNALAPNRSRASDGAIGDDAHRSQGSASDHNPWYGPGIVTARDFTHDPANGLDCNKLAAALISAKDPRVKYLIWQGRLMDSRSVSGNGFRPWTWQSSSGHYQHLHLSVMDNPSADDARTWSLPGLSPEEDTMGQNLDETTMTNYNRVKVPAPAVWNETERRVTSTEKEVLDFVVADDFEGKPTRTDRIISRTEGRVVDVLEELAEMKAMLIKLVAGQAAK